MAAVGLLDAAMRVYVVRKLLGSARPFAWRQAGAEIGPDVWIGPRVRIRFAANVKIGAGSLLGGATLLDSWGPITIGRNCILNDRVELLTASHRLGSPTFEGDIRSISIGDYVWMPMQIIVLPGVAIGDHAVVGTGSVVARDVPAAAVVAGNPARQVGTRPEADFRYVPGRREFV